MRFAKINWSDNSELSEKNMTYEVLILVALTYASRASALHHLDIRYMVKP